MWDITLKASVGITPWLALAVSVIAVVIGISSYRLSKQIQRELKGDEILIAGVLHNPSLVHPDHENCVIQTTIFNKSRRKAFIDRVVAFDSKGDEIDITWSDHIDELGNPQGRSQLVGVVDSVSLCIRRNDGDAFRHTRVEITHSFNSAPMIVIYDIDPGWQAYFAKG
jgi:hypothetical protein